MPRKIKDFEIERILMNFSDSDVSDTDEPEQSEFVNDLFEAFDNNRSYLMQELSREGAYEININEIDDEDDEDDFVDSGTGAKNIGCLNEGDRNVVETVGKGTCVLEAGHVGEEAYVGGETEENSIPIEINKIVIKK